MKGRLGVAAATAAAMLSLTACARPPVGTVLEPDGWAAWNNTDGALTVGVEVRNTGPHSVVFGAPEPVPGFREIETGLLFGADETWVDAPPDLRLTPTELLVGESARVYVKLSVNDCDRIGEWEERADGQIHFSSTSGNPVAIDVWWADKPAETVPFSLDVVPALQLGPLDPKVCR